MWRRIVAVVRGLCDRVLSVVRRALGEEGEELSIGGTHLRLGPKIAEGGYSIIHVGYSVTKGGGRGRRTGRRFAVKRLLCHDEETLQAALQEGALLDSLPPHPCIIAFFGSLQRDARRPKGGGGGGEGGEGRTEVLLLTDFCSGGALSEALGAARDRAPHLPIDMRGLLVILHQVFRAVAHLHVQTPPIAHRDLKMENVLLGGPLASCLAGTSRVLLCDFGSATTRAQVYETRKEIVEEEERIQAKTTLAYRAPEMADLYQKKRVDEKVDIWALGVLTYTVCYNRFPFDPASPLGILSGRFSYPEPPGSLEEEKVVRELITATLQVDPEARPPASALLQMMEGLRLPRAGSGGEGAAWAELKGEEAV